MIAENDISALTVWLAEAGLNGVAEDALVAGFCERAGAIGLPVNRCLVLIDTLHPVYEGRLFRWGHDPSQPGVVEYGRTALPEGLVLGAEEERAAASWRASPFFHMLQTGETLMRLTEAHTAWFPVMQDYIDAGMKGGAAIVNRFAREGVIGEMDAVYSSWMTRRPGGFSEDHLAALARLVPSLALAVKTLALTRMTGTLMETCAASPASPIPRPSR